MTSFLLSLVCLNCPPGSSFSFRTFSSMVKTFGMDTTCLHCPVCFSRTVENADIHVVSPETRMQACILVLDWVLEWEHGQLLCVSTRDLFSN